MVESSTSRVQRFLRGSVACLLTANAFALVILSGGGDLTPSDAPAAEQGTQTITIIRSADGSTTQVDPGTEAGRAAIQQAERNGGTISTIRVPATSSTTNTTLASKKGTDPLGNVTDQLGGTVDQTQSTLDGVIDGVQSTVDSVVGQNPLDPVIDQTQTTLQSTVDTVQQTATTLQSTVTTVTSILNNTLQNPTGAVSGVLGGVTNTTTGSTGGLLGL